MGRQTPPDSASGNANSQDELASSLVKCMGRESAIHVCKLNGWTGVLHAIEAEDAPLEVD